MSKNRIGFQLVDLQNKNLTSGATVTIHGLFNVITKAEGKPCVVTGLRIGNKNRNDEVVTFVKDNNKYVGAISDGTLEITSNSVKFTTVTPVSVLSEAVQTLNTEVATLNTAKANNTSLGVVELTNTATVAHTTGTYFIWGGQFVVATSDIDIGVTITDTGDNANVESTTVADLITAINGSLSEITGKTASVSATTPADGDTEVHISYPTGFNFNNCIVIGFHVFVADGSHSIENVPSNIISVSLYNEYINIISGTSSAYGSGWRNKTAEIILLKMS